MATRRVARLLRWGALGLVGLVGLALLTVRLMYGGGQPYPDVSTAPELEADRLTPLVELPYPPGNVAASPDGRVFFTIHPFGGPERFTDAFVFELVDGSPQPFPSMEAQPDFVGALGLTVDAHNRLWIVRPAGIEDRKTKLYAFDLASRQRVVDVAFEDGLAPFAQDLRVSPDGKTVFLADTGVFRFTDPALIVFDVATQTPRRVLESHPSVAPQDWVITAGGEPYKVFYGLVTFSVGVDGLAVSHDGRWLYYATMSHDTLYRIETSALIDPELSPAELEAAIEAVGTKPLSDGIEIDSAGNVYVTDVEHGGVARIDTEGQLTTLVRRDDIVWADGITMTAEGDLLFTDSEIPAYIDPLLRPPARAALDTAAPHRIWRVKL